MRTSIRLFLLCALACIIGAGVGGRCHAQASPIFVQKLLSSDGELSDDFGTAVSHSGQWLAVGAHREDEAAPEAGAVYMYQQGVNAEWSETQKLMATDAIDGMFFGRFVSMRNDWLLVSALGASPGAPTGSVYIYQRQPDDVWIQYDKLFHPTTTGGRIGTSSAFDGEYALFSDFSNSVLASNSGAVQVYRVDASGQWAFHQELTPSDPIILRQFGWSVAISGSIAVIGAIDGIFLNGSGVGAAYIFRETDGVWIEEAKIVHPSGMMGDGFGISVDIRNDLVVVGADQDDVDGVVNAGSVHVFREVAPGDWQHEAMLTRPPLPDAADEFGEIVSILPGSVIAVGAPVAECDGVIDSGAAYLFSLNSASVWDHRATICPPSASLWDELPSSIDASSTQLFVGNIGDDDLAQFAGAALVYDIADLLCTTDLNNDGTVDTADLGLLISAFGSSCDGCAADINDDGSVDTADLGALIGAFGMGCP